MKKVLITGGSGLLAVNWAYLMRHEFLVVLVMHNRIIRLNNTSSEIISLEDKSKLYAAVKSIMPDYIVHTAAIANIELCEKDHQKAKKINVEISSNVSDICKKLNIKLLYISTDHLFSGNNKYISESVNPEPINMYGITKYQSEQEVMKSNPASLIIRTNFFGWGPIYRTSFSDYILNKLRSNASVNLYDDVFFSPISIEELVSKSHSLLKKNCKGIFNIVGNERLSKYEFGIKLAKTFNLNELLIKKISSTTYPQLVVRPKDMSLSNKKMSDVLGEGILSLDKQIYNLKNQEQHIKKYLAQ